MDQNQQAARKERVLDGRRIVFDGEDFFDDPDDWSEAAALILAKEAGLDHLTDTHWRVVKFLREFYYYNGRAPLNKKLKAGVKMSIGEIENLFPGGIKYGARRLAGLPNPKSCL